MAPPPEIAIKAPNGKEFVLPTGLFIDNEFVESSDCGKLPSINPAYVYNSLKSENLTLNWPDFPKSINIDTVQKMRLFLRRNWRDLRLNCSKGYL